MRDPAFWWTKGSRTAALLSPLGAVYGAVALRRLAQPGARMPVPVICVGNPTLGGAGKTPAAILIAGMLSRAGRQPFLLSRGYRGRLDGPVLVDPSRHTAGDVGDEPLLLARAAPTVVARHRHRGAALAVEMGAGSIVMDDGFQNPSLAKDVSILVLDARRGVGNGHVFPAGPLRAPLAPQLARADAVILVGEGDAPAGLSGVTTLRARLVPDPAVVTRFAGKRMLAFAGIGDPEKFFVTLSDAGIILDRHRAFADHHGYTAEEARMLIAAADESGLALITTEKDAARIAGDPALAALAARVGVLPVTLVPDDEAGLRDVLLAPFQAPSRSG